MRAEPVFAPPRVTAIATKPAGSSLIDHDRPEPATRGGYRGFVDFCEQLGADLEPFQRRIARAVLGTEREALILLPRGNGKSSLMALVAVHHLLTHPDARIYCVAASVPQARILHEYAADFARRLEHPNIVFRHLELRFCPDPDEPTVFTGHMRVLGAEAPRLHGLSPSLMILDELQAVTREGIYEALASAIHKRPDAKLITISTAGVGAESTLGRLRRRALGLPDVRHRGAATDARGPDLRMLAWEVPEEANVEHVAEVKKANPASWITTDALREQRKRLPDIAYRRFVANQWVGRMGSWLPAGAWQACAGDATIPEGTDVWLAIDVGGSRADTAVVWIDKELRVGVRIFSGTDAYLEVAALVPSLAQHFQIREVLFDPWRAQPLMHTFEQRGIKTTAFAQSDSRMVPASAALHHAIVEGKITHPDDERLNAHIAAAVARHGRRGWRIDQAEKGTPVDGAVALVMAFEGVTAPQPQPTRVLGWL